MSGFSTKIADDVRAKMTLLPPPPYSVDDKGTLSVQPPPPPRMVARYQDYANDKLRYFVYAEHVSDDYNHPDDPNHEYYLLRIRCLPSDYDLRLILDAARHMLLLDRYEILRYRNADLDDRYEKELLEVHYQIASQVVAVDNCYPFGSVSMRELVQVNYHTRLRIFSELFQAAGYRVKWGNAINIRKR